MTESTKKRKLVVLGAGLVLAASPLLAACGGGSSSDASATATAVDNTAVPTDTSTETQAPAGGVKLANGEAPAERTIKVTKGAFNPNTLTIKVGQNVTFKSGDSGSYGVKVGDLDSATVSGGLIETFEFSKAGTYNVSEEIYSGTATITVE